MSGFPEPLPHRQLTPLVRAVHVANESTIALLKLQTCTTFHCAGLQLHNTAQACLQQGKRRTAGQLRAAGLQCMPRRVLPWSLC